MGTLISSTLKVASTFYSVNIYINGVGNMMILVTFS